MEIEHHAHHPEAPVHKKNWKSYIREFLMLFLAVFFGFLAENQREDMIDHQLEEEYVVSFIQDLKIDTANLGAYIIKRAEKRILMDSLTFLLTTGQHKKMGNAAYYFARLVYDGAPFVSTDGTMQQLKAGNLRLIRNEKVVNAILDYDTKVKALKEWDEADNKIRITFREIGGSIFKADIFYKMADTTLHFSRPDNNPQLITDDPVAVNNVAFQVQYLSVMTLGNYRRGIKTRANAADLIRFLKKEYKIN
ncbi:MAG: hypothetical protein ACKVOU_15475 [Cytophagales bacterium]